MPITKLYFTDIGPFDEISFEFDRQVNVFTGPNNTGKTTALLVLGELLVYPFAAPAKFYRSHNPNWKIDYSIGNETKFIEGNMPSDVDKMLELYEAVGYTCFLPAQRSGTDFRASGPSPQKNLESHIDGLVDQVARARPNDLRRQGEEDGTLAVSRNEPDIAGWTADEILRNFLEVSTPTDMATAEHVTRLEELRHKDELTDDEERELQCLRRTVGSEILRGPTSALVENFAEELRRVRDGPSDSSAAISSRPGAKRKTRRSRN